MQPATPVTEHLVVFARPPILGQVKTRLAGVVGDTAALALYRAFLIDSIALARRAHSSNERVVEVCFAGPWSPDGAIAAALGRLRTTLQGPGDLGRRLARLFARSREAGHARCVVIGADSPTLPVATVEAAFARLEAGHDVALAPAEDGGFVLLGLGPAPPDLGAFFADVPWGTAAVAESTLERSRGAGLSIAQLDGWYDVDDGAGLARLRAELADRRVAARALATRGVLDDL